ncbi:MULTISPECIES: hypothetical protein [unclassified Rathayibacter]|uniref:hypothetical protein n=1 Tax=unclassified Rathayibacter TaxID=2609250 RepID=UPI00188A9162|nr:MULTISPECIES: hypothetical protein [unclassified Rathayibacter]MBF4462215.1 hypothetical protein [Rathayibacter sp. VKM Ac-2879]MBF4503742.1 hypothetical protein [Rathayibacter sp. VKM Ac-2878]
MQWWNEFSLWLQSADGHQAVFLAVVLLLAVVMGGIVAAAVFRASISRLLRQQDHERKNAVIATLIDAAVDASAWNVLGPQERVLSDRASAQAETHLRLLPIKGSGVAANWASHELAELKHSATTGGYQTHAGVAEFRDRLVQWRDKPNRARKAFLADLERWRFSETGRPSATELAEATSSLEPAPEAAPAASSAGSVVVGAGRAEAPAEYQRPAEATIVLPPAETTPAHAETRQLLDDVERLDVPSRERPVEELPAVENAAPADPGTEHEAPSERAAERESGTPARPTE